MECKRLRACRKKTFDQFVESRMPDVLYLQEVKLNEGAVPEKTLGMLSGIIMAEEGYSGTAVFRRRNRLRCVRIFPEASTEEKEG